MDCRIKSGNDEATGGRHSKMRRCLKSKSPTSKSATRRVMLAVGIGLLAGATGAAFAAGAEEPALQFYNSPAVAAAKPPFSQAVRVGDVVYLSGSIGIVPGTRQLAPGGIDAEARQTMENIGAVLKANGRPSTKSMSPISSPAAYPPDPLSAQAPWRLARSWSSNAGPMRGNDDQE
jgi:enamine deaminase RidA (YjgF/YER057c/UK114 family)